MSGNVGGTDGNQPNINIRKPLNLTKLDKLVGKSTEGSIWAGFDSTENGGNANNVFDAAEINAIKTYLKTETNISADMLAYFESETKEAQSQQPAKEAPPPTENKTFTNYTVQPGDTPEKLAQKFGIQGEDAENFINHLKTQTNKKGWFSVGQRITLLGEHSETIKNMAEYSEDERTLQKRWASTDSGQKAIAAAEARKKAAQAEQQKQEVKQQPQRPAQQADKTPNSQRITISSVQNQGRVYGKQLKEHIGTFATSNDATRKMLAKDITNRNIAYIIDSYPDLVTDIDDEWGMDINDVKKYVINPLNSRLRELGMNKHCIPNDLSKLDMKQIQELCSKTAKLVRDTDKDNGYVFKPAAGNEGKIHRPRKASQKGHMALPARNVKKSGATTAPAKQKFKLKTSFKDLSQAEYAKYLLPSETTLPKNVRDKLVDFRMNGFNPTLTQADDLTYKMVIKASDHNAFSMPTGRFLDEEVGMLKMGEERTIRFDAQGNPLNLESKGMLGFKETKNYTQDGTLAKGKPSLSVDFVNHSYKALDAQRTSQADKVPTAISISRSKDASGGEIAFANALEQNKEKIMKQLGITNAEYDELARMAMGIAEQETHYGSYSYNGDLQARNIAKDFGVADLMYATGMKDGYQSHGITQMKFLLHYSDKNPGLKNQFTRLGITKEADFYKYTNISSTQGDMVQKTPNYDNQAIATMVLLNNIRISTKNPNGTWAKLLKQNDALIDKLNAEGKIDIPVYKDGKFVRHNYGPHSAEALNRVRITENDIMAMRWNGVGDTEDDKMGELKGLLSRLKDPNDPVLITDNTKDAEGRLTHKRSMRYAQNVRAYMSEHQVTTNKASLNRANALGADSQGNNGRLGSVIFMPNAYTTNVKNSSNDIKTLQEALANSNIPEDIQQQLIAAVKRNDIAFGYGLTADEAASLTANDAKLLLAKLDDLKGKTQNLVDPAKIREAAKEIQDSFRSDYLQSRQVVANNLDLKRQGAGVLDGLASNRGRSERLLARGERKIIINDANVRYFRDGAGRSKVTKDGGQYYGFGVEADKGVNPYLADGSRIRKQDQVLAECASDVAAIMDCGGRCATGVKASLESAGIVGHRSDIKFTNPDGTTNKCENAKDLATYFSKNPNKFEEVKYLDQGNGTSREINASDIRKLPAGYIVVYIPGENFENQAGHALITNGNGQGYADEVDNMRWDDFVSGGAGNGKGEHGKFKIFRLKV
ncbi:MAG: LysM peptidoglycan-binding domain-containing protein [Fusobacterium sp.]|nr:LysM peptidoglycan-binding domain-containing protein [Fusobacterium sp.]